MYTYAYTSLNIYIYSLYTHTLTYVLNTQSNSLSYSRYLLQVSKFVNPHWEAEVYEEQLRTLQSEMEAIDEEAMNLPGDGNSTDLKKASQKSLIISEILIDGIRNSSNGFGERKLVDIQCASVNQRLDFIDLIDLWIYNSVDCLAS